MKPIICLQKVKHRGAEQSRKRLFEGDSGGSYTSSSLRRVFHDGVSKGGIQKSVRLHDLRHSFATHLLKSDTDSRYIQRLLGQNNLNTTEIYLQVSKTYINLINSPLDDKGHSLYNVNSRYINVRVHLRKHLT